MESYCQRRNEAIGALQAFGAGEGILRIVFLFPSSSMKPQVLKNGDVIVVLNRECAPDLFSDEIWNYLESLKFDSEELVKTEQELLAEETAEDMAKLYVSDSGSKSRKHRRVEVEELEDDVLPPPTTTKYGRGVRPPGAFWMTSVSKKESEKRWEELKKKKEILDKLNLSNFLICGQVASATIHLLQKFGGQQVTSFMHGVVVIASAEELNKSKPAPKLLKAKSSGCPIIAEATVQDVLGSLELTEDMLQ